MSNGIAKDLEQKLELGNHQCNLGLVPKLLNIVTVSLRDLASYIAHLDDLLVVLHAFYDQCLPETEQEEAKYMESRKQETLRTSEMNRLADSTRDRKRRCMASYCTWPFLPPSHDTHTLSLYSLFPHVVYLTPTPYFI